jgi:hypothetical protein
VYRPHERLEVGDRRGAIDAVRAVGGAPCTLSFPGLPVGDMLENASPRLAVKGSAWALGFHGVLERRLAR